MVTTRRTEAVLRLVDAERRRQEAKWGVQRHEPSDWLMILGEEFGEASKAALDSYADGGSLDHYREEMVQVAAVAVAAIEALDMGCGRTARVTPSGRQ